MSSPPGDGVRQVTAWFDDPADAVAVAKELERNGIDGDAIHLPASERDADDVEDADTNVGSGVRRRFSIVGAATATVLLGVVVAIVVFATGADPGLVVAAAIGAAFVGFFIGGFFGVMASLPANPETLDAEAASASGAGAGRLDVDVDAESRRVVEGVLKGRARRLETR